MTQAWITAALTRTDKMPSLESMLEKVRPPRKQTVEEMKAALREAKSIPVKRRLRHG